MIGVVVFAVESLRVVWDVVLCVCREADCSEFSSSFTLAMLSWKSVGVVGCRDGSFVV